MGKKRLYLIDATAFCYRAFYALTRLSTSFGQPTNAIYGFIKMLNKILKKNNPDYLAVCFDVSRDTFRARKFADYKIQRPPMPDELSSQIPFIKQIVSSYGIAILEKEGFEADDIIATVARRARKEGLNTTIISSDKDILQLVDEDTVVFSPYKDEGVTYDKKMVIERFGASPKMISDIIALMGDATDNIPGVPGIGEKTAVELVKRFGSLQGLLHNLKELDKEKLRQSISDNLDKIKLNKELAVLDDNVDIDCDLDKLRVGSADIAGLVKLFRHLEFKTLLGELPSEEKETSAVKCEFINDGELGRIIRDGDELFLYGDNPENMFFALRSRIFRVDKIGKNLNGILLDPKVNKVSHDLKKIKRFLAQAGIALEGLYFDVMIAAHLLDPAKSGYALDDLSIDYLGQRASAETVENEEAIALISQIKPKLEDALRDKSLLGLFRDIEMPLVEVLSDMELAGVKLDTKLLKKLSGDIEKRLVSLISSIYDLSGAQFNINSPKQLREILFERLKLPVVKRSKTGPSTDEEVLRRLADKHKLPALLLEYRQLMKLKTTYIDTLPGLIDPKTGMLHTWFNQTATETGRLSSANPNLQNIPVRTDIGAQIRRSITASSEDNYLLSCDYSQIELRILAHLSKDEKLKLSFKQDKDIHKATASLIYGLDEKDVTAQMREMAKRVNFGIVYGLTSYGLARDLNIPPDEAQGFIDAYFTRYPKVKDYIQEQIKLAKDQGFVTTILGRRRYIPEINNKNQAIRQFAQRQAVNAPIQGSASDLIKLAMIDIHRRIKTRNLKSRMVLQIHDELVFDMPKPELAVLVELVKDRMENVLKLDVPIRVDTKLGQNWLEMEDVE
jgi:DNA polymerase-1